jgi:uncharacterized protein DUF3500
MTTRIRLRVAVLITSFLALAGMERVVALRANSAMVRAANEFLGTLTPEQRAKAVFAFDDAERLNWHFIPRERRGLPFKEMTEAQRAAARRLLQAGLSQRGYLKANTIIELELVLRETGGNPTVRDPELYFFSIFGSPAANRLWGWRTEGHHLSLNFTVANDSLVATAPSFFGANPAHVRSGSRQGLRALAAEEDLARALVSALDSSQRAVAVLPIEAPRELITGNAGQVDPLTPAGISIKQLRANQSAMLLRLVDEYLARMTPEVAKQRRARLERSDFSAVTFAWAGSLESGKPHYYRVQGPTFLIEYDNTQNDANHIHSVWRDFAGDFGRDLLREHYRSSTH